MTPDGDDKPGDPLASLGDEIALGYGDGIAAAIRQAIVKEQEADLRRRLAEVSWCQSCGLSATGAERGLLSHALAMNYVLAVIRWTAEARAVGGMVPAADILRALDEPYRFPLPDGPRSADAAHDGGAWLDHLATCPECHRICDHRNTIARGTWALLCEEGRAMRPDLEDTERPAKT